MPSSNRRQFSHPTTYQSEQPADRDLRATAYHEAGHAVAFWEQCLKFKKASIIPNETEGTLGRLVAKIPKWFDEDVYGPSVRHRVYAERRIISLLAGTAAQSRYLRRRVRVGMEQDYRIATYLIMSFFGTRRLASAYFNFVWCSAEALVKAHWYAVSNVAQDLLRHKEMTYQQVVASISRGPKQRRSAN